MRTLNFFIKAITFIPILTSVLYVTGIVRMQSFLKEFAIDSRFYDAAIDRIIFDGFLNIFIISASPIISAMYAAIILFIIMAVFGIVSESSFIKRKLKSIIQKYIKKNSKPTSSVLEAHRLDEKIKHASTILSNTLIAGVIFILVVLLITKASQVGINDANKLKFNIAERTESQVCVKTSEKIIPAYLLYCGSSFCGFWADKMAIVIPTSAITSIESNSDRCITKT